MLKNTGHTWKPPTPSGTCSLHREHWLRKMYNHQTSTCVHVTHTGDAACTFGFCVKMTDVCFPHSPMHALTGIFHGQHIHFKPTHLMLSSFCSPLQIFRQGTDPQRDGHNRRNTVNVSYGENGCDQQLPPLLVRTTSSYPQCHPSSVTFHQKSSFPYRHQSSLKEQAC